jgi:hypothetical protein
MCGGQGGGGGFAGLFLSESEIQAPPIKYFGCVPDGWQMITYSMLVVALPSLAMRLDFQIQAPISSSISEKFRATVDRRR